MQVQLEVELEKAILEAALQLLHIRLSQGQGELVYNEIRQYVIPTFNECLEAVKSEVLLYRP